MDKIDKTDEQWRAELSDLEYKVMRKHGTERAFSHDDFPKEPGTFACKGCGRPLFESRTKFDSASSSPGWFVPISTTTKSSSGRTPSNVSGTPMWLLKLFGLCVPRSLVESTV